MIAYQRRCFIAGTICGVGDLDRVKRITAGMPLTPGYTYAVDHQLVSSSDGKSGLVEITFKMQTKKTITITR